MFSFSFVSTKPIKISQQLKHLRNKMKQIQEQYCRANRLKYNERGKSGKDVSKFPVSSINTRQGLGQRKKMVGSNVIVH